MSSRLFTEVRERRGLAYYVFGTNHAYTDAGSLYAQSGVDINRIDDAVTTIVEQFRLLADEPVPSDELEKARNFAKGRFVLQLESPHGTIMFGLRREVLEGRAEEPQAVLDALDAVTAEDIQRVAREIVEDGPLPRRDRAVRRRRAVRAAARLAAAERLPGLGDGLARVLDRGRVPRIPLADRQRPARTRRAPARTPRRRRAPSRGCSAAARPSRRRPPTAPPARAPGSSTRRSRRGRAPRARPCARRRRRANPRPPRPAAANARSKSGSAASLSPDERRSRPRSRSTRTRTRGSSSVTSSSSRSPAA